MSPVMHGHDLPNFSFWGPFTLNERQGRKMSKIKMADIKKIDNMNCQAQKNKID